MKERMDRSFLRRVAAVMAVSFVALHGVSQSTVVRFSGTSESGIVKLIDYDNGNVIDSVAIKDNTAVFDNGKLRSGVVRLAFGGSEFATFIVDGNDVRVDIVTENIEGGIRRTWNSTGGLNDTINSMREKLNPISRRFVAARDKASRDSILAEFNSVMFETAKRNIHNPAGYYLCSAASDLTAVQLNQLVSLNPDLREY